jgi:hypothetical protein
MKLGKIAPRPQSFLGPGGIMERLAIKTFENIGFLIRMNFPTTENLFQNINTRIYTWIWWTKSFASIYWRYLQGWRNHNKRFRSLPDIEPICRQFLFQLLIIGFTSISMLEAYRGLKLPCNLLTPENDHLQIYSPWIYPPFTTSWKWFNIDHASLFGTSAKIFLK